MRVSFFSQWARRLLATSKTDQADAYKHLPLSELVELAAVATPRNPSGGLRYGFIRRAQLFGSTAAVLHYNCLPRWIAPLVCRFSKVPYVRHYDNSGIVIPRSSAKAALCAFTKFNGTLFVGPKRPKSEASSFLEVLGPTASLRDDGGGATARLALSEEKIRKRVESA